MRRTAALLSGALAECFPTMLRHPYRGPQDARGHCSLFIPAGFPQVKSRIRLISALEKLSPGHFTNRRFHGDDWRSFGKNGVLDRVLGHLQRERIVRIKVEALGLDSTSVKVHPDGRGGPKKRSASPRSKAECLLSVRARLSWRAPFVAPASPEAPSWLQRSGEAGATKGAKHRGLTVEAGRGGETALRKPRSCPSLPGALKPGWRNRARDGASRKRRARLGRG